VALAKDDLKDMRLPPSLSGGERRRVKAVRQSELQPKRRLGRGSAQEWPLFSIMRLIDDNVESFFGHQRSERHLEDVLPSVPIFFHSGLDTDLSSKSLL